MDPVPRLLLVDEDTERVRHLHARLGGQVASAIAEARAAVKRGVDVVFVRVERPGSVGEGFLREVLADGLPGYRLLGCGDDNLDVTTALRERGALQWFRPCPKEMESRIRAALDDAARQHADRQELDHLVHDLNNLMVVLTGYAQQLRVEAENPAVRGILRTIDRAVARLSAAADRSSDEPKAAQDEHKTVLVVDDEPMVLQVAESALKRGGYEVLAAKNAIEALKIWDERGADIDLLVTDVVMPGMSGRELAKHVLADRPDLPVLMVSGYDPSVMSTDGPMGTFLPKPWRPAQLLEVVAKLIGGDTT